MTLNNLEKALNELKIPEISTKLKLFDRYRELVLEWNEKVNLTAIKDPLEFEKKHFIDSVAIADDQEFKEALRVADVGTGAGFPGIPLAILFPKKSFFLMDSLNKRIKILKEICKELNLDNVQLFHGRAEELARQKEHREKYDLCLSRAVANLAVLSEYCLPFVRVGGWFGAYKSMDSEEEIEGAKKAIEMLGGNLVEIRPVTFDQIGLNHQILWIRKEEKSLPKYPRKAGTPAKDPLK